MACSVEGCGGSRYCKGFCIKHYKRWTKYGDPHVVRPSGRQRGTCSIDGCADPHFGRGWCHKHYTRWWIHGDASVVLPRPSAAGPASGTWIGDAVGYCGAHDRVRALRGVPSLHPCAHCAGPAMDWAYDHTDPDELISHRSPRHPSGQRYSADPERYIALCRRCHKNFDVPASTAATA